MFVEKDRKKRSRIRRLRTLKRLQTCDSYGFMEKIGVSISVSAFCAITLCMTNVRNLTASLSPCF